MSVYDLLATRVITAMTERTRLPWRRPWRTPIGPSNLQSRRAYKGINFILLSLMEFESPWFVTFKQARALGGTVKAGEKGLPVVFWSLIEKRKEGEEKARKIPLLRLSTVFNLTQCEGLEPPDLGEGNSFCGALSERCEDIVDGYVLPPRIHKSAPLASYSLLEDLVRIPPRESFFSEAEFYCTLFHELVHSTAHPSRLDRKLVSSTDRAHEGAYSFEELVAEFGATFLCAKTGIDASTFDNSVAYLQGWAAAIKARPKMLVEAASAAQRAVERILGATNTRETEDLESDVSTKGTIGKEAA